MLLKLLTLLGVALTIWGAARSAFAVADGRLGPRPDARTDARPGARRAGAGDVDDLIRCADCGAWRPDGPCSCRLPPIP